MINDLIPQRVDGASDGMLPTTSCSLPSSSGISSLRVPWSADEDEDIKITYAYANGGFPSYRSQAAELNRKFHGGKSVRSAAGVRRREGKIL